MTNKFKNEENVIGRDFKMEKLSRRAVIATTTFYGANLENGFVRAEIARRSLEGAVNSGYEVICVDGGSPDEFLRGLEMAGVKVYAQTQKGMGVGRRQAIREAFNGGRDFILWTEPEKESYISQASQTISPLMEGAAEMVVPARVSLDSYPIVQRYAERIGNAFFKELTGVDLDIWFGPRVFNRNLARYFTDYDGEYGDKWDSIFIPVLDAILGGERVLKVEVDYKHPQEQTASEEQDIIFYRRRIEQLESLTKAMHKHWLANKNG